MRPLELDTFRKILKACSAKREMLYLAQSSSGMRVGEMVQLRKKDIHTDAARLMVKIPAAFTKTRGRQDHVLQRRGRQAGDSEAEKDWRLRSGVRHRPRCPETTLACEAQIHVAAIQKKMGISDKYETNGRNVITTHSFRAYFITKVSRQGSQPGKVRFAGQKGYLLQYDRQTDAEKLENLH